MERTMFKKNNEEVSVSNAPMTVGRLIKLLRNTVKNGTLKLTSEIHMAGDEEGNTYSPVVFEGIMLEGDKLVLYPLFQEYAE